MREDLNVEESLENMDRPIKRIEKDRRDRPGYLQLGIELRGMASSLPPLEIGLRLEAGWASKRNPRRIPLLQRKTTS